MMPAAVKERLLMLRESFMHAPGFQDWVAAWWSSLQVDDRRLLMALCGLDDSIEAARRPWKQHRQEDRDTLLTECKRVARLVEGLKWA